MFKKGIICLLALLLFLLTACTPAAETTGAADVVEVVESGEDMINSAEERETGDLTSQESMENLTLGNTQFAVDLYQQLRTGEGNLFYSPYSISLALAMTYTGARGNTEVQMAEALSFDLSQDQLHPAFNALDQVLASRGEGAQGRDGQGFRLNIVNALWGQEGYSFLPEYLDLLARSYGAGMRTVDYAADTEGSRQLINNWVAEQTEDRVRDLIPQGILNDLTRLVLTNAVYFNAAWQNPFDENATSNESFETLNGEILSVPMMRQLTDFGYAEGDGFVAVELPYDGNELSMVIMLPDQGSFLDVEANLSAEQIRDLMDSLARSNIALTMPKFETTAEFSLSEELKAMGMSDAFGMDADFSGMDGTKDLFIKEVLHKAFIAVDEAGTEAAAATAVVMQLKGVMERPLEISIDRPFLFFIRDIETGTILFMGRILDPTR